MGRGLLVVAALVTFAGCSSPRLGNRARLEQLAGERRNLDEALDRLEERLLADQATVKLWGELRDRHEDVAQVACRNLDEHAQAMAAFDGQQRLKHVAAKKSRVAARYLPSAEIRR